jgi:4Fe-4S ferredoxin
MKTISHLQKVFPVVNHSKCEAKGPCVIVCPHNVFEIQDITNTDRGNLTLFGKLKTFVHGKDKCSGCGLCVSACPEKAIKLLQMKSIEYTN